MGPPRFKRRSNQQSIRFTRNAKFRVLDNGRLRLPKIGDMRVAWSRELPSVPSSVTVVKTPTGKYYASFVVAVDDDADLLEPLADPEAETGIDLGLKDFAVLRGGQVIENPRFFRRLERKLAKAQRVLARKAKGSANRAKARARVAKVHERIKDARSDWVDKQVKTIVAEDQGIYVEDLNAKGLARGRHAKSIHDAAFGMFLTRLESKAARTGRTFVKVDRFFPSTRLCSACGALTGPAGLEGLKVRAWGCGCGAVHDRDVNAEINIRREGRRLVAEGHSDTRNASGQDVRPGRPGGPGKPREGQNEEPTRSGTAQAAPKPGVLIHLGRGGCQHYGSREALLDALRGPERFAAVWNLLIDHIKANPTLWMASFELFMLAQRSPEIAEAYAQGQSGATAAMAAPVTGEIEETIDAETIRTVGSVQMALVSGIVMQWLSYPDEAPGPEQIAAGLKGIVATLEE